MKINYCHYFGKQSTNDISVGFLTAEIESNEEQFALDNGWLFDKGVWYQCRSTRIDTDIFVPKKSFPSSYKTEIKSIDQCDQSKISEIYKKYIKYKNYDDLFDPLDYTNKSKFLLVYDDADLIAFTKFITYNCGLESNMFCWDYSEPKMSLGKCIVNKEIEYARSLGLRYLYYGPGYESSCEYKTHIKGFEWWTGKAWSTDKELFRELINSDSQVTTIDQLEEAKEKFLDRL